MSPRWRLALPLGLCLAGLAALAWRTTPPARPEAPLAAPAPQADFTVDTAAGPLTLSSLQGRAVIVYFGYTACPDICPTTMATAAAAMKLLEEAERARVTLLLVSVDPERDTPARLAEYAAFFHPQFLAGTRPPAEVAAIAADWGVVFRKTAGDGSAMGYSVDHSTWSFLVGPDGARLGRIDHGTPADALARRLRDALTTAAPPAP